MGLLSKDAVAPTHWDLGCTHGRRAVWLFLPKLPNPVWPVTSVSTFQTVVDAVAFSAPHPVF